MKYVGKEYRHSFKFRLPSVLSVLKRKKERKKKWVITYSGTIWFLLGGLKAVDLFDTVVRR